MIDRERLEQEKKKLDRSYLFKYIDIFAERPGHDIGFYNPRKLLTFNRPFSFVTGGRKRGKSTAMAGLFLIDFLMTGNSFGYIRRDDTELKKSYEKFFSDAINIINEKESIPFTIYDFYARGGDYYIDAAGAPKTRCGFYLPLKAAQDYKGAVPDNPVYNIDYDEFMAEESTGYLGSKDTPETEYNKIMSIYSTYNRCRGHLLWNRLRMFFTGNLADAYNPIFLKFNISDYYDEKASFIRPKGKMWVVEQVEPLPEDDDEMLLDFSYQVADEQQRTYMFGKGGRVDGVDYIRPLPDNAQYICTLSFKKKQFGVYRDASTYNYYIGKCKDIGMRPIALDNDSHRDDDLMLVTKWRDFPIMQVLLDKYRKNQLYFTDSVKKRIFLIYFKLMPDH